MNAASPRRGGLPVGGRSCGLSSRHHPRSGPSSATAHALAQAVAEARWGNGSPLGALRPAGDVPTTTAGHPEGQVLISPAGPTTNQTKDQLITLVKGIDFSTSPQR